MSFSKDELCKKAIHDESNSLMSTLSEGKVFVIVGLKFKFWEFWEFITGK
jgi:hypothetical protein